MIFNDQNLTTEPAPNPSAPSAFSIKIAVNPLVAAASPLLSFASRLRDQAQEPNLSKLQQQLSAEVRAFENKIHEMGYRSQVILAARYLVCALLDEFILNQSWGKQGNWEKISLLQTFQRETWGGERFFLILERGAADPQLYIEVLELGYICLSLGFQGQYKDETQHQQLGLVIDNLYHLIRQQRGEFSNKLLQANLPNPVDKRSVLKLPPVWLTLLITAILILGLYIPYHQKLSQLTQPVVQFIQQLGSQHD